jgi:lysophospholipase L1-like esterase
MQKSALHRVLGRHALKGLFLGTLLYGASLLARPGQADPVKILPLGDSITQGNHQTQSYRYPLWKKLVDAGVDFQFVGSQDSNVEGRNPQWPDYGGKAFDRRHEGHWGWHTDLFLQDETLRSWLKNYTPDIVLMHIGTNDMFRRSSIEETVIKQKRIIELLRQDNPKVAILLARLIPSTSEQNAQISKLNEQAGEIAAAMTSSDSPVIVVDQNSGFNAAVGADTYDGTHPNAAGEEKMAQRWFDAIRKVLEKSAPKPAENNGP